MTLLTVRRTAAGARSRATSRAIALAFALAPAFALASAFALAPAAHAQANASAAATAMGGAYSALARNFNAALWNPANLGLPGNSRFSIALSPQVAIGTGPITGADLVEYEGIVVPQAVREQWLQKVIDNGGQDLSGDVHVTPLAFSIGRFAFSATTTVNSDGALPPAVAELLLFGNAGRTGVPQDYTLADLAADANAITTLGVAYGRRLPVVPIGDLAVGITAKYLIGHGAASLRDNGSTVTSSPLAIDLDAPLVVTDTGSWRSGSGYGLDIGASWTVGAIQASAVVHDIVSSFAWDTDELYYLPVRATFQQGSASEFTDSLVPLSNAPADVQELLRERIDAVTPSPTLALGVAWSGLPRLTLAAELRQRFGEGIELGPETQVGAGAELRVIPFVPLRAGISARRDQLRLSGGLGFEFGVVNFQLAGVLMQAESRTDTGFGFTLSFGGR